MSPSVFLLAAIPYLLLGFLIFLAIDSEEMAARVPYGDAPAIMSLRSIRWITGTMSCAFWLPAILVGCMTVLAQRVFRSLLPSP